MKFRSKQLETFYYDLVECVEVIDYDNYFKVDIEEYIDNKMLILDCKIYMLGYMILDIIKKESQSKKEKDFIDNIVEGYMKKRKIDENGDREYDMYSFMYDYTDIIFADIINKYFE